MVAGPISDWLGVRTWYMIGGSACIIIALASLFIPVIMNIEENRQKKPVESQAEQIPI
jgi:MFS family permease